MNEPKAASVTATAGGITMTIDLHQMLTAIDPGGRWIGYDPDRDEERYEPSSLALQIADLTADRLTKAMRREVVGMIESRVADTIADEVKAMVNDYIEGREVQQTDEFGTAIGHPKPLTQMIVEAATKGLNQKDGYNGPTRLQKMVDEAVGRAFKNELASAVKDAKTAALNAVQQSAAEVIRETIARAAL